MPTRKRESTAASPVPGGRGEARTARGVDLAALREWDPTRTWSIRSKIIAVLSLPVIALVLMWVLATWVTLGPGLVLLDGRTANDQVGRPTQTVIIELQSERKASAVYLASGPAARTALTEQRRRTDDAITAFRSQAGSSSARSALTDEGLARLADVLRYLDTLPSLRSDVDAGSLDRFGTSRRYTQIVDAGFDLTISLVRLSDENLARQGQALVRLAQAREVLAQEDAIVSGALAAEMLTTADFTQVVQLIGAQRHQFAQAETDLDATDQLAYEAIAESEAATTLAVLENRLIEQGRPGQAPPIDPVTWHRSVDDVMTDLDVLAQEAANRLLDRATPQARWVFVRLGLATVVGLGTIVVTAFASLRVGRSLIRRLAGLRQAALELAIDRLPRVVGRLRRGEEVNVAEEAPPLPYGGDEIGAVGHAFNALQRTAVESAVAEANLRRGINEVFLNIARRSQSLLHKQLSILDRMERRAEDPNELEDLFRVDHLATRMRRHAEDLVILAGATPGRGWRNPVPLVDVLRGAISEVEDYARVTLRPVPEVAIAGRAVGDVIHLLAELIENATNFSHPNTRVDVGAEPVTNGLAVEISDRGLGMSAQILAEQNDRLANPPDFAQIAARAVAESDPSSSAQLGLFVVARLAERHGVRVQLRSSPYGGVTAVVLLPGSLLARPGELTALAGAGGAGPSAGPLVELPDASPTAPRSPGFQPIPGQGGALPSRRPAAGWTTGPATGSTGSAGSGAGGGDESGARLASVADADTMVISAVTGKPAGRHSAREVIEPEPDDVDGLPRRVRQRNLPRGLTQADAARAEARGQGETSDSTDSQGAGSATQGDGARSPEQVRAMMSSFQAGMDRGRAEAAAGRDDAVTGERDAAHGGQGEDDQTHQGPVDGWTTGEAT